MPKSTPAAKARKAPAPLVRDLTAIAVRRPPWLDDLLFPWRLCAQRILVVADGLDFNEDNDFGLTRFLLALETSSPYGLAPIIHIAHRDDSDAVASAAMKAKFTFHKNFRFVNSGAAHALMNGTARRFDQLWIFGIGSAPIPDPEVRVIAAFMAARGGVFATGDHSSLGRGMSGRLPRIRKMREWQAVPMGGPGRIDTVNEPSPDGEWNFDSQSDTLPQRIFPHFDTSTGSPLAHPLLRLPGSTDPRFGVIDVLPDHPHESECFAGSALHEPYDLVSGIDGNEFPVLPGSAQRLSPQIVATSVSGGRIVEKGPVAPRCFGAISAYDGHRVALGRIVCDATWHHFVNVNLDGTGAAGRSGLGEFVPPGSTNFVPNAAYAKVAQYYRNIAHWIAPVRWCRWYLDLVAIRFSFPLFEELPEIPPRPPWPELVDIGTLVESALDRRDGRGTAADFVGELLAAQPALEALAGVNGVPAQGSLVPATEFRRGVLGTVAHAVFAELPASPWQLRSQYEKRKDPHAEVDKLFARALKQAARDGAAHYAQSAKSTLASLERLAR